MNSAWRQHRDDLDQAWEEWRAAIMVGWRVDTPELRAEKDRAQAAFMALLDRHEGTIPVFGRR